MSYVLRLVSAPGKRTQFFDTSPAVPLNGLMFIKPDTLKTFEEIFQGLDRLERLNSAHQLKIDRRLAALQSDLRVILFDIVRATLPDVVLERNNCNLNPQEPLK